MSSDESTSTQISTISNTNELKPHKAEQWEINLVGNFLLGLYHRLVIGPQNDWTCKKSDIRKEFQSFVTPELSKRLKGLNGTDNIGTLMHRCGYLSNTPRNCNLYKLKGRILFEFRNKKLVEQDKRRVNDDANSDTTTGPEDILRSLTQQHKILALQVNYEIDEDSPEHPLQYEGTTMEPRRPNYHPTNMSCFLCQLDFPTMDSYEEHIQKHNDETEFEYLKELSRFDSPIFSLSYRLCKNSHHFCFTIASKNTNLVIEKIVIIQSRSMFYVHNMRVPYDMPASGSEHFYVDSHLFAMFVEQPIVLVCHIKDSKDTRIIEEHHFMRALEFPKVNFAIKPYRLPSNKTFTSHFKLPDYFPPLEIRNALKDDFIYEKLMKTSNEFRDYVRNGKILQPQTIGPTLTTLLHIEDMDAIKEYLNLLQHNVKLRSFGDNYTMRIRTKQHVHIENVLSLFDDVIITTRKDIKADSESLVKLILQNRDDMKMSDTYVGQIEDVNSGRVSFKCYKKLDLQRAYTIIFRPSRLQLRYQYRAMELLPVVMQFLKKFLFPGQLVRKEPSSLSLELYNKNICNNPEQLQAVRNIAEGPRNDATYIIFGPPGTGKTTTLVESILQVLKRDGTKILVTASSNSACDEVALRLCKTLSTIDMSRAIVRIYAQSNEARMDTIDDLLLEHSNMYSVHFYPDVEVLHEYRIVVCTTAVVAKLSTGKFGRRDNSSTLYTHLFIDEVAASTEVETLMAITSILTPKSCLIIAGDHKQLGPIVKSKRAEEFNLAVSLMDRLLERECYRVNTDTGDYNRTIQSRLRLNFRSHPAIVNLYSGMYYNHDLEAKANIDDVSLVKDWHMAPSKDFPIIFHSVDGKSYSDNHSFSLYNSDEINIVMDYVKDLMYFGVNGKPVNESDVGIISPYKKQYLRIREELNLRKWYGIETGSVESFQGKEKDIIIVSFVRSGTQTLGFLESPRRLNVTLSRAKSLLILIGNASTLSINPDYDYIVKECQRHKTLIGSLANKHAPYFNNDEKQDRRRNNRYKPYNNKDSPVDKVNESLKDLNLKNNTENENSKNENSKTKKNQRCQRGAKTYLSDKDKDNKNNINNESDDDNDVADADDEDNDNQPTTPKASGKKNLSQPTKKKNQSQNQNVGKGHISNGGDKKNAKDSPASNSNLEAYFNELPNVPNTDTKTPTPSLTTVQSPAMHMNQVPPLMAVGQRQQTPQMYQLNYTQPYPFNPTQFGPQIRYGPPQQMESLLGMPPPNYNMGPHQNHQQWQQGHQQWQQGHQQGQQQWNQYQQRPQANMYMQQPVPQQHQFQSVGTDRRKQQKTPCNKNNTPLSADNLKTKNDTKSKDITSESKSAHRPRNGKTNQQTNIANEYNENNEENNSSTTKTPGKPHLAHAMKKKTQNQNGGKISKANLSINKIKEVTAAQPKTATPRSLHPRPASPKDVQGPLKIQQQLQAQTTGSPTKLVATQNPSLSNKKPQPLERSKQSSPKVIASIPSISPGRSTTTQAATTTSTTSSTDASFRSLTRPNAAPIINLTSQAGNNAIPTEASVGNTRNSSSGLNRTPIVYPILNQKSNNPFDQTTETTNVSDSLRASIPGATPGTINVSNSLRASIPGATPGTNVSNSLRASIPGATSGTTNVSNSLRASIPGATSGNTNVSNSLVSSIPASNSLAANNQRHSSVNSPSNSYTRSSSIRTGAEALHYNQPHRPVRSLEFPDKKKDNCVIA